VTNSIIVHLAQEGSLDKQKLEEVLQKHELTLEGIERKPELVF
jgi:hypothetical protein